MCQEMSECVGGGMVMAAVGRLIDTQKGQATERAERESVCMCVWGG